MKEGGKVIGSKVRVVRAYEIKRRSSEMYRAESSSTEYPGLETRSCVDGSERDDDDDDHDAKRDHPPVEIPPPPRIVIAPLLQAQQLRLEGHFHIVVGLHHFRRHLGLRRQGQEGCDEPSKGEDEAHAERVHLDVASPEDGLGC